MKFQAIIFDLDGTLLDTIQDLANSMNAVLERRGYPIHPVDAYRYFVGEGVELLVRRALPQKARHDHIVNQCLDAMREEYHRRWAEQSKPYDGIAEMLSWFQEREIPMAILSNKPHEFTQIVVRELLSDWNFCKVLGARRDVPKKPDPAGALEIAQELNFSPKDIVFLGDTKTDMETANAAGMHAVGVLWGFRDREELAKSGAKLIVEKPIEVVRLF